MAFKYEIDNPFKRFLVPTGSDALRENIETLQLGPGRTLQISSDSARNSVSFEPSLSEQRETFCVMPWLYLQLFSHGEVKPCCKFKQFIAKDGASMSVYKQSLGEIWNSDEMRNIRRAMVRGERVTGCADCYREEEAGGLSLRKSRNLDWQAGWYNKDRMSIPDFKAKAVADDYRLSTPPSWLQLDVGNLCNLRCRMCQGYSSSQINRDAVHRQWNGAAPADEKRTLEGKRWFQDKNFIATELIPHPKHLKTLEFMGGETLLIKEVGDILQYLIDAGAAENIFLMATTNGTVVKSSWLELTERFQELHLNVSIDGFDKYYEYIRYPARWSTLTGNIEILKKQSRTHLTAIATLQAYNALNIVELFKYLDSVELDFYSYPVTHPGYLSPNVLPPRARQLAVKRLSSYAETDCLPKNRELVMGLAKGLEKPGDPETFDESLMRAFMLFTNDLDITRGQSFRSTHEELLQLITDAGFKWTNETLHACCHSPTA